MARGVPLPSPARGRDLGLIAAENRAAAAEANARLGKARACILQEQEAYKNAK